MTGKTLKPCGKCNGKGWRWGRNRDGDTKRNCSVCKGKGRVRVKPGSET